MTCPEAFIPDWSANTTVCPGGKVKEQFKGGSSNLHIFISLSTGLEYKHAISKNSTRKWSMVQEGAKQNKKKLLKSEETNHLGTF